MAQIASSSKLEFHNWALYISDRFNHRIRRVGGPSLPQFVRGDANADDQFDISDPIKVIDVLFLAGSADCLAALDANDDEFVDVSDIVFILDALFVSGGLPSSPFPACGVDPTGAVLSCDSFDLCP